MLDTIVLVAIILAISVIGFWLGNVFSKMIVPANKVEFKILDALQALSKGKIEIWEQFKLLNVSWDNTICNYDFSNCILSGVNFKGITFRNVKFIEANLDNADFSYSSINDCSFERAFLRYSNFSNAKILDTTFMSSLVINSDFSRCNLNTIDFVSADLQNANFNETKGINIKLNNANLQNTSFSNSNIKADVSIIKDDSTKLNNEGENIKSIIIEICHKPKTIFELNPRIMEEIVAELFIDMGYLVQKTALYKDSGYDLVLNNKSVIGDMTYFVEVKRYAPEKKVGVELIRVAYGILALNNINGFIIVTTSSFSPAAVEFSQRYKQIKLIDGNQLIKWINDYCEQKINAI
jgi:uncharacterized protein YjbI with pentapeptide repeats